MRIVIDTAQPLSRTEADLLRLLLNAHPGLETPAEEAPAPAKKAAKKATKKAAPAKQPAPAPEDAEEPTEDAEEPFDAELMQSALDRATEFMNQGRRDEVKAALAAANVGRVRDISTNAQLNQFWDALS